MYVYVAYVIWDFPPIIFENVFFTVSRIRQRLRNRRRIASKLTQQWLKHQKFVRILTKKLGKLQFNWILSKMTKLWQLNQVELQPINHFVVPKYGFSMILKQPFEPGNAEILCEFSSGSFIWFSGLLCRLGFLVVSWQFWAWLVALYLE